MPLAEDVVVLRSSIRVHLHRMLQDGATIDLSIIGPVVFAVETLLLDVVDGHEDLRQFRHPAQLLRFDFLRLRVQFNLLCFNLFKFTVVLRNIIIQLQDFVTFILLILVNALLQSFRLVLQFLVALFQVLVCLDQ